MYVLYSVFNVEQKTRLHVNNFLKPAVLSTLSVSILNTLTYYAYTLYDYTVSDSDSEYVRMPS